MIAFNKTEKLSEANCRTDMCPNRCKIMTGKPSLLLSRKLEVKLQLLIVLQFYSFIKLFILYLLFNDIAVGVCICDFYFPCFDSYFVQKDTLGQTSCLTKINIT